MNNDPKLVILDRDGVVNEDSPHYIKSVDEYHLLSGSIDAIAALTRAGYRVVIATNQSGLGRGLFDLDALEAIHARLNDAVHAAGGALDGIFYCPHTPDDECDCRKPRPGLLDAIAAELDTPVRDAWLVGDSLRDLEAGLTRGCRPVLVRTGKGAETETTLAERLPAVTVPVYNDLLAFATDLLDAPA